MQYLALREIQAVPAVSSSHKEWLACASLAHLATSLPPATDQWRALDAIEDDITSTFPAPEQLPPKALPFVETSQEAALPEALPEPMTEPMTDPMTDPITDATPDATPDAMADAMAESLEGEISRVLQRAAVGACIVQFQWCNADRDAAYNRHQTRDMTHAEEQSVAHVGRALHYQEHPVNDASMLAEALHHLRLEKMHDFHSRRREAILLERSRRALADRAGKYTDAQKVELVQKASVFLDSGADAYDYIFREAAHHQRREQIEARRAEAAAEAEAQAGADALKANEAAAEDFANSFQGQRTLWDVIMRR